MDNEEGGHKRCEYGAGRRVSWMEHKTNEDILQMVITNDEKADPG